MNESIKKRIAAINSGIIPEGYKKTKVGIVPVEWERYKLCDISDELTEKAGNNTYETLSISAGIGFVNQANKFGKELSGKQYEKYIVLHKGDFSYNKGNSKKYPQGCIYQLKDRDEAAVPNVFESFRLNKGINDYYEQLFVSGFLNSQLFAKINHGVRDDGLLNLKGEDFYSCYVPSPPLPEQQKIAEILSTQDKLIELQEKIIEHLKELKKAYLQKMFPKKGSKYPELRFKGFTKEWEQLRFENIFSVSQGLQIPISDRFTEPGKDRYFYITNEFLKDDCDKAYYIASPSKSVICNKDDILMTRTGNTGIVITDISGCFHNNFFKIKYDKATMSKKYIFYLLSSPSMQRTLLNSAGSSTIPDLSHKAFYKIKALFPPSKEEQEKIGKYMKTIDIIIKLNQRKLNQEKQKKKALMQLLLTGKVRCI